MEGEFGNDAAMRGDGFQFQEGGMINYGVLGSSARSFLHNSKVVVGYRYLISNLKYSRRDIWSLKTSPEVCVCVCVRQTSNNIRGRPTLPRTQSDTISHPAFVYC